MLEKTISKEVDNKGFAVSSNNESQVPSPPQKKTKTKTKQNKFLGSFAYKTLFNKI